MRMLLLLLATVLVVGCATPGPATAPAASAPVATAPRAVSGLSPALEAQRLRLVEVLAGTPVVVAPTETRQLRVQIPLKFAFEPASTTLKPPLAAVLDQVMTGYKPQTLLSEMRIYAPADGAGTSALAQSRARSVRDHLVARGLPAGRVVGLGQANGANVEIVISDRVAAR